MTIREIQIKQALYRLLTGTWEDYKDNLMNWLEALTDWRPSLPVKVRKD